MYSSKIHKQQQIQVVIRFKPQIQQTAHIAHFGKCVYTSHEENQLIVETPNKKEYFVFDNIADQNATQQDIYNKIGKEILQSSTQGYNCCIFAYGQTGAGKTYSILGKASDLNNDIYADSRGIIPRLLDDLLTWVKNYSQSCTVMCSYMEIYNQQIFDLLNIDTKGHQIRQDIKRGVFVDKLSQQPIKSYVQGMDVLMRGLKNRKVGQTSMNKQSSRSHTIFTLNLQFSAQQKVTDSKNEIKTHTKHRKAKINIVDLAGSQRAKLTKVQGQRLKQGCNINKSLHVLGNVINALVQSTKKKKHIPFRDSKLTYFLKDSLGGNSVTKLLANIQPNRRFISDTLSTLMFAKRAKILRMKVQINQNISSQQNFQSLRVEIKKLRQQLAQARFIKNNQSKLSINEKMSVDGEQSMYSQPWIEPQGFDLIKNQKIIKIFEQNQTNYKSLIQIYEQHMKNCIHQKQHNQLNQSKKTINIHHEWKTLQKKNNALMSLIKNFPAFTSIFKQNVILKSDNQTSKRKLNRVSNNFKSNNSLILQKTVDFKNLDHLKQSGFFQEQNKESNNKVLKETYEKIINTYENLLSQIQQKMKEKLQSLQSSYQQILKQNYQKDQKIKQLKKRSQVPVQLQSLVNENQYLKLNVLELQSQISILVQKQRKHRNSFKNSKKSFRNSERSQLQSINQENIMIDIEQLNQSQVQEIIENLQLIKKQALQQIQIYEKQMQQAQNFIEKLKEQLKNSFQQNKKLIKQNQNFLIQNQQLKNKLNQLLKISSEGQITKDRDTSVNQTNTFWTNQQWSQELMNQFQPNIQNQNISQDKILILQQQYKKQVCQLKQELKLHQAQRKGFTGQLQGLKVRLSLIEKEFGKPLTDIIDSYRQKKKMVQSP